ncbi:MAG: hypothetical protein D3923_01090, partial [Candidatus Electrothrix sp. AR3]|nr:hypothetical protein [Candidatus Electrothrix sp. AR3]
DNQRPVLYAGTGSLYGHAFVCDGYMNADYFHFNWGWSGINDGYFYLNALTPGGDNFSTDQEAIIGITPAVPSGPDLIVLSSSVSDNTLEPSQAFDILATAKNQGTAISGGTTMRYYLSADAFISTADTQIGTDVVGILAINGTSAESITVAAPEIDGSYYVGACLHALLNEADTSNNCSTGIHILVETPPQPDLVVISPTVNTVELDPGQSFNISATAKNQGMATAASTTMRYYLSADAVITTTDNQIGTDAVGQLAINETSLESTASTAPIAEGSYYVGACLDALSNESASNNNCSSGVEIEVIDNTFPDLAVTTPTTNKAELFPGEPFIYSATVNNQGTKASTATHLRCYRSSDATVNSSDLLVGNENIGIINPTESIGQDIDLTAPVTLGTYWIGSCVEAIGGDPNSGNDCSSAISVAVTNNQPDLLVTTLDAPTDAKAGEVIESFAEFSNQGTRAAFATTASYYYENTSTGAISSQKHKEEIPALAIDQILSRPVEISAPCTEGEYLLLVCIDSGENPESDSDNNCLSTSLSVTGVCPAMPFLPALNLLL